MSGKNAPYPCSERAIYGFVLYIGTFVALGIWVVWAALPDPWLNAMGFTYIPQRYWLVALPTYFCAVFGFIVLMFFANTNAHVPGFDAQSTFTDDYYKTCPNEEEESESVPALHDIDFLDVTKRLCERYKNMVDADEPQD